MDKKAILKRIIEEQGNCDWIEKVPVDICKLCPMAINKDGTFTSCLYVVFGARFDPRNMVGSDLHKAYRDKAIELLENLEIEDMLRGEDGYYAADSDTREDS